MQVHTHRWRSAGFITGTNAIRYPAPHIVSRRWCECGAKWVRVRPL